MRYLWIIYLLSRTGYSIQLLFHIISRLDLWGFGLSVTDYSNICTSYDFRFAYPNDGERALYSKEIMTNFEVIEVNNWKMLITRQSYLLSTLENFIMRCCPSTCFWRVQVYVSATIHSEGADRDLPSSLREAPLVQLISSFARSPSSFNLVGLRDTWVYSQERKPACQAYIAFQYLV